MCSGGRGEALGEQVMELKEKRQCGIGFEEVKGKSRNLLGKFQC